MQLDPRTLDVIDAIRGCGYSISLVYDKKSFVATAKDATGQTWTTQAADACAAAMQLAEQLGIDLPDG